MFASQKSEQEINKAKLSAVSDATLVNTTAKEWCDHRHTQYGDNIPCLEEIFMPQLASHLSSFVFEVRKKTREEFPPESLHHSLWDTKAHVDERKKRY